MEQVSEKQSVIYSIGHGNRKIEEFIMLLKQNKIDILIDVRSLPYSRFHSQFRKFNLSESLQRAGITYQWLGQELGGRPTDPGLYYNGKVSYNAIKETVIFKAGIRQVLALAEENIKVTLMCSESDPNDCHRKHLIADELAKMGTTVLHVNKVGSIEQHVNHSNYSLFS